jgi:fibronectin type 3 domain-containing protein
MGGKKITAAALIGISLFMSACQFSAEPDAVIPGDGLVALRIEADTNGARSVLPGVTSLDDISYFSLYGTASTAQNAEEHWLTDFWYGFDDEVVYVRPGTWKFTLKGFSEKDELLVQGSLQRVIAENFSETLHFVLSFPNTAGATGSISITITLPPDSGAVSVETSVDGVSLDPALEIETSTEGARIVYEDDAIPIGDHLITFSLYDGAENLIAANTEIAVIKGNVQSTKTITLTAFNGPPAAPSGLTVTDYDGSTLSLSWTDNSWNETGFVLNDGSTDYPFPAASTTGAIDFPTPVQTTFRLKAVNGFGESSTAVRELVLDLPEAPGGLSAGTATTSSINISWTAVSNTDSYRIYRSDAADGTYSEIGASDTASYTDTGLSTDTIYYYKVRAVNVWGESEQSTYIPAATRLPSPSGLSAGTVTTSSISISWTAVSNADTYKIYRSNAAAGTYSAVGTSGTASYTDTGLSPGTTYYYKVSAVNAWGESEQSTYIPAATRLPPPSDLSAGTVTTSGVSISWTAVSNADSYKIYRSDATDGTYSEVGTSNTASYEDLGLLPDTSYYYKVSAINVWWESELSVYIRATTRVLPPSGLSVELTPLTDASLSTEPSLTVPKGQNATITAAGTWLSYQWYVDGVLVSGATSSQFIFTTAARNPRVYNVTLVVTGSNGEKRSARSRVTVTN